MPPILPMRFIFFEAPGPENCLTIWFIMSNCFKKLVDLLDLHARARCNAAFAAVVEHRRVFALKGVIDWMIALRARDGLFVKLRILRAPIFIPGIMPARSCKLPMPLSWTS